MLDEVRNSLYYVEHTLFELAPQLHVEMRRALADAYPGVEFSLPPFLRIGSWVGGDRDGNPFVTLAVTEETLRTQKALALRLYRGVIDGMYGVLSTSERFGVSDDLRASLAARCRALSRRSSALCRALSRPALPPEDGVCLPEAAGH